MKTPYLDELEKAKRHDQIALCILYWADPQTASEENIKEAEQAAEELLALRARVEELQTAKNASDTLLKEAEYLFNQLGGLCDDANTEEWMWKWKVKYYFEETDIPPHAMPILPEKGE